MNLGTSHLITRGGSWFFIRTQYFISPNYGAHFFFRMLQGTDYFFYLENMGTIFLVCYKTLYRMVHKLVGIDTFYSKFSINRNILFWANFIFNKILMFGTHKLDLESVYPRASTWYIYDCSSNHWIPLTLEFVVVYILPVYANLIYCAILMTCMTHQPYVAYIRGWGDLEILIRGGRIL